MHEFALAEAVMASVVAAADREGLGHITMIRLKIGELQQIDKDTFAYILNEVIRGQSEILRNASIEIETEVATLHCKVCEHTWPFGESLNGLSEDRREAVHFIPELAHSYITCPVCHSPDFIFVKGRGISVDAVMGD